MVERTPRLGLDNFEVGDQDWDHSDTVVAVDEYAIDRGPIEDRPAEGEYDDELYLAVDQRVLWRWDESSDDWVATGGTGSDGAALPALHTGSLNGTPLVTSSRSTAELNEELRELEERGGGALVLSR